MKTEIEDKPRVGMGEERAGTRSARPFENFCEFCETKNPKGVQLL